MSIYGSLKAKNGNFTAIGGFTILPRTLLFARFSGPRILRPVYNSPCFYARFRCYLFFSSATHNFLFFILSFLARFLFPVRFSSLRRPSFQFMGNDFVDSRGSVFTLPKNPPTFSNQFRSTIWIVRLFFLIS